MGCFLDVLEKNCDDGAESIKATGPTEAESLWMCCCPLPYEGCVREDRFEGCDDALFKYVLPLSRLGLGPASISLLPQLRLALLDVREHMRLSGDSDCMNHAQRVPEMPACGFEDIPPAQRSI